MSGQETLHTLLAEYPVTRAIHDGTVSSPLITFDFAPYKTANKGFKPMVRDLAFDAGELAIATFLQAKDWGKPLVLLPATISGRFQHHTIAYNAERGPLHPGDLAGKKVGVRAYTQTTGLWVRGILQTQYGVDPTSVTWITTEDAHVAEYENPPYVEMAEYDKSFLQMLLDGDIDAAILGKDMPEDDPRIKPLIPDAKAAGEEWYTMTGGAVSMNHMVVVQQALCDRRPDVVQELFRLFKESKAAADLGKGRDMRPYGLEALRPGLEMAVEYSFQQGLIRRRLEVDELFDDVTIGLK